MNLLTNSNSVHVQQMHEGFELIGFETRNKYKILDENHSQLAYAAEQRKGFGDTILRQFIGHWRSFDVVVFDNNKQPLFKLNFPFRFFFKTLFVTEANGKKIGHLQQRFAIFRKKFDVYDSNDQLVAKINSSFFRFWTFEFFQHGQSLGKIQKKWSGALTEIFTDKDNFVVSFNGGLGDDLRALMLSTCIMVDIIYFENNKASATDLFN